jgi:hypothetical protein
MVTLKWLKAELPSDGVHGSNVSISEDQPEKQKYKSVVYRQSIVSSRASVLLPCPVN